jgi:hypothetical protein
MNMAAVAVGIYHAVLLVIVLGGSVYLFKNKLI